MQPLVMFRTPLPLLNSNTPAIKAMSRSGTRSLYRTETRQRTESYFSVFPQGSQRTTLGDGTIAYFQSRHPVLYVDNSSTILRGSVLQHYEANLKANQTMSFDCQQKSVRAKRNPISLKRLRGVIHYIHLHRLYGCLTCSKPRTVLAIPGFDLEIKSEIHN